MIHGTADFEYPLARARAEYDAAEAPKLFMTIEGGNHSEDYRVGPKAVAADTAALAFFDFALKDRDEARDSLVRTAGVDADLG